MRERREERVRMRRKLLEEVMKVRVVDERGNVQPLCR